MILELCSHAKHGGPVFSVISGSMEDPTTVPGSYDHLSFMKMMTFAPELVLYVFKTFTILPLNLDQTTPDHITKRPVFHLDFGTVYIHECSFRSCQLHLTFYCHPNISDTFFTACVILYAPKYFRYVCRGRNKPF